jgi:hypothetical protein
MKARIAALALALIASAGCGGRNEKTTEPDAEKKPITESPAIVAERTLADRNAGHDDLTAVQKVGGAEGRSPFEGDRVIGLNAIVRRSLDVSREFDKAAPTIRAAVDAAAAGGDRAAAEAGIATVNGLYGRAKAALDDWAKAEADLKASGEYFDEAIFYGMTKFVADVEQELREEKEALAAKLAG